MRSVTYCLPVLARILHAPIAMDARRLSIRFSCLALKGRGFSRAFRR